MNATTNDATGRTYAGARTTGPSASKATSQSATPLHDEFNALVSDAQDLVNHTVDAVGAQAVSARAKLQSRLAKTKEQLSAGADALGKSGRQAAGAADDYVRERPWQMIAVAAIAGVAVGALLSRR